jgi:ribosomal protein S18 acetylase RimI-like enzyme
MFRGTGQNIIHVQHTSEYEGATFLLPNTKGIEIHELVAPRENDGRNNGRKTKLKDIRIRNLATSDYPFIISVVNEWWKGRNMTDMLPRLFFIHFQGTSFIAEFNGKIVEFIIGFISQTFRNESYIHFVGISPDFRKQGLARILYEKFFDEIYKLGCNVVRCVTSPVNNGSIAFHLKMGFSIETASERFDDIPVKKNHDGPGEDRISFYIHKKMASSSGYMPPTASPMDQSIQGKL